MGAPKGNKFAVGNKGGGRRKLPDWLYEEGDAAWKRKCEMAKTAEDPKIRAMCDTVILEYVYGKPSQEIDAGSELTNMFKAIAGIERINEPGNKGSNQVCKTV